MNWRTTPRWCDPKTLVWVAEQLERNAESASDHVRIAEAMGHPRQVDRSRAVSAAYTRVAETLRRRARRLGGDRGGF